MRGLTSTLDPRRRPRGARRLHLLRRLEAAGGRAPTARPRRRKRSSPSRPTRSTSCASPTRVNRRCSRSPTAGWKMIEPAQIDADPPEAIGVAHGAHQRRDRPRRRRERDRPRAVRPRQPADHGGVQGRRRRVGNAEARQQERHAGRDVRGQGRREAGVPGVVVPGDQLQPQAVRPARQEDPEVRSRQGGFAGRWSKGADTLELARSGSEWKVVKPVPSRSDYSAIEGFLTRLSSSNMSKLVEENAEGPREVRARQAVDDGDDRRRQREDRARGRQDRGRRDLREGRVAADGLHGRHDAAGRSRTRASTTTGRRSCSSSGRSTSRSFARCSMRRAARRPTSSRR